GTRYCMRNIAAVCSNVSPLLCPSCSGRARTGQARDLLFPRRSGGLFRRETRPGPACRSGAGGRSPPNGAHITESGLFDRQNPDGPMHRCRGQGPEQIVPPTRLPVERGQRSPGVGLRLFRSPPDGGFWLGRARPKGLRAVALLLSYSSSKFLSVFMIWQ
ncbi:hypothetical protein GGR56DRAFT_623076, partial [Xylariaceae sp. FL0804]